MHYVLSEYLFLMLINKTDDSVKCYFKLTILSKKGQPSLFAIHMCYSYR